MGFVLYLLLMTRRNRVNSVIGQICLFEAKVK